MSYFVILSQHVGPDHHLKTCLPRILHSKSVEYMFRTVTGQPINRPPTQPARAVMRPLLPSPAAVWPRPPRPRRPSAQLAPSHLSPLCPATPAPSSRQLRHLQVSGWHHARCAHCACVHTPCVRVRGADSDGVVVVPGSSGEYQSAATQQIATAEITAVEAVNVVSVAYTGGQVRTDAGSSPHHDGPLPTVCLPGTFSRNVGQRHSSQEATGGVFCSGCSSCALKHAHPGPPHSSLPVKRSMR